MPGLSHLLLQYIVHCSPDEAIARQSQCNLFAMPASAYSSWADSVLTVLTRMSRKTRKEGKPHGRAAF